jgi:hypothetical protein
MTTLAPTRCRPRHSPSWSAAERRDKHAHYAPAYALLRCQNVVPIKTTNEPCLTRAPLLDLSNDVCVRIVKALAGFSDP